MCQSDAKFLAQRKPASLARRSRGPEAALASLRGAVAVLGGLAFLASAGCESPPAEAPEAEAPAAAQPAPVDPAAFSGEQAFAHLQALATIGPRVTGSRGAARARAYLSRQLRELGAQVEELRLLVPEPGAAEAISRGEEPAYAEVVHVVATLPGRSEDRFVLAASYDTREIPGVDFVGANASASGPALLVELARALSHRDRPYTIVIVLLDGDRLPAAVSGRGGFPGTRAWAAHLAQQEGGFDRFRLAVFFQQVGDVDLEIARDLRSHHVYREFFWEAAGVLGRGAYFPADAGVESVAGAHVELLDAGLPRTVLVSDPRFGGSEVPGRYAASEKDVVLRCSPHSLGVVGEVTLEALDRIARRLERIDRFRASPLDDPLGRAPAGSPD